MNTAMDGGMSMPDMNLKAMKKMNAMKMSEPMKKMDDKETENPKKDADMSKVKDKQVMLKAMMKKEAEVPAEPMKKLNTGEKMKEEAEPMTSECKHARFPEGEASGHGELFEGVASFHVWPLFLSCSSPT